MAKTLEELQTMICDNDCQIQVNPVYGLCKPIVWTELMQDTCSEFYHVWTGIQPGDDQPCICGKLEWKDRQTYKWGQLVEKLQ